MSAHSRILVLGAGELGLAVLRGISQKADQTSSPIRLDVLLRSDPHGSSDPKKQELTKDLDALEVNVVLGDVALDSEDALSSTFASYDLVICCVGFVSASSTQVKITRAVLAAGVKRYVPWQFGVDYDAIGRGSAQDLWDEQLDVRDLLRGQSRTEWVIVSTGIFTSFLFEPFFGIYDATTHSVHGLGSWENSVTATTPDDIGHLTAEVALRHWTNTSGSVVFVGGDTVSYLDVAKIVEEATGRQVEREVWTVPRLALELESDPEDAIKKYRVVFAQGKGVSWPKETTFNHRNNISVTTVRDWAKKHLH